MQMFFAMLGLVAILAITVGTVFVLYYWWKVEIEPLTKGLRWMKVRKKDTTYGAISYYDWVDPKTYGGPIYGEQPDCEGF